MHVELGENAASNQVRLSCTTFHDGVVGVSGQTGKDCLFTSENGRGVKSRKNKTKIQKILTLFCRTGVFLRLSN